MTTLEKELIRSLVFGKISREEFVQKYPVDLLTDPNYALKGLEISIKERSAENVERFLHLISFEPNWIQSSEYADVLCSLLKETFHFRHEDVVLLLQKMKNPRTVDCIYDRALVIPEYMDYDDSYSLARKCIHALGDINTEESKAKLVLLSNSTIPVISEKAKKQLSYL